MRRLHVDLLPRTLHADALRHYSCAIFAVKWFSYSFFLSNPIEIHPWIWLPQKRTVVLNIMRVRGHWPRTFWPRFVIWIHRWIMVKNCSCDEEWHPNIQLGCGSVVMLEHLLLMKYWSERKKRIEGFVSIFNIMTNNRFARVRLIVDDRGAIIFEAFSRSVTNLFTKTQMVLIFYFFHIVFPVKLNRNMWTPNVNGSW